MAVKISSLNNCDIKTKSPAQTITNSYIKSFVSNIIIVNYLFKARFLVFETMENVSNKCRICLRVKKPRKLVSLFDENAKNIMKIFVLTGVKVNILILVLIALSEISLNQTYSF